MPLVFVHGVDTRDGEPYRASRRTKRELFEKHLLGAVLDGRTLDPVCLDDDVSFPYWGHLGASFRLDMASLPPPTGESLGSAGAEDVALQPALATWSDLAPETMNDQDALLLLATTVSFGDAIKVLNDAIIQTATSDEAGAFVAAASEYATATPKPKWLVDMKSDGQFIDRLVTAVIAPPNGSETLGAFSSIGNAVHKAANRLKSSARGVTNATASGAAKLASPWAVARWRRGINAVAGRFTGDAFHYLHGRTVNGKSGPIVEVVAHAFERASAAGGPLVVVGHSLGGIISFDVLSSFRSDIEVELYVSVGSQISHFDEMGLLRSSAPGSTALAQKPTNIRRWINVFDPVDILAYACEGVFSGVEDLRYESGTHTLHAHSAYFEQDAFYERLRKRMDQ